MPDMLAPYQQYDGGLAGATILQIIPTLDSGGAERTTLEIVEALTGAGARALVAAEGGRLVGEIQAMGGEFHTFPAATKNPLAMWANVRHLARLIEQEGVDLVHARSRAPGWVALGATRRTQRPYVTTYHGVYSDDSKNKRRYNSVMARGDIVIANSAYTADHIVARYPEAENRIVRIHRGVDLKLFSPDAATADRVRRLREIWQAPPGERIVLMPARLARRKGHLILIEAAKRLRASGRTDLLFVMAGDEEHHSFATMLDETIRQAGASRFMRRVGHCADMPAAYMAAACVVAPATEPEAFGRVAVEAQAMGAPVVVSDIGASGETVLAPPDCPPARRTGWRIRAGDADALAEAIAEAVDLGAAARDALATRARMRAQALFSVERMRSATLAVYERLIHGQNTPLS